MRLIDADALIAEYDRVHVGEPGGARKLMENAPTVDAVPVVRCKDCKYARLTYSGECKYCDIWFPDEAVYLDGDEFCSAAERKEE